MSDIFFDPATHTYLVDGQKVPGVTEILAPLHRSYGKINQSVLDQAARRGTAVHEALEMLDLGMDFEVFPETAPYIMAYQEWLDVYRPSWIGIEKTVFSEEGWFAGTLDRIGNIVGDRLAIVDIKTSTPNRESYVSVCLQTTAYAIAYASQNRFDPNWTDISRYGLFLMKNGAYRCIDCKEWEGANHIDPGEAFASLLHTHKLVDRLLETRGKK